MTRNSKTMRGRNFLMTPGPSNIPDRVLAAMNRPAVDLTDTEFMAVTESCFADLARLLRTEGQVIFYASNGHGAWEAALANLICEGDLVLVPSTGMFSRAWGNLAGDLGAEVEETEGDWRSAFDPIRIEERLRADPGHRIKAVLAVQTDTATSVTSDIAAVRRALDACAHPALLMADVVASLGTVDFRMDEWGVDVAVAGSQKGLMVPPGLGFTAVSQRALEASRTAGVRRGYWDWERRLDDDEFYMKFFGTPPEHFIWALREALDMLFEEGLETAFARHRRLACAVHAAVGVWGRAGALELNAVNPVERANAVTTILVGQGIDADRMRLLARDELDVSLGVGLGRLSGRAFRIGHMGWVNEPMLLGALGVVEMVLQAVGVPHEKGGVTAAVDALTASRFPPSDYADAASCRSGAGTSASGDGSMITAR